MITSKAFESTNSNHNLFIVGIRAKFPIAGDFQEIDFGYVGPAYDRYSGKKVHIIQWGDGPKHLDADIGIVTVQENDLEFTTPCYWYVK